MVGVVGVDGVKGGFCCTNGVSFPNEYSNEIFDGRYSCSKVVVEKDFSYLVG